MASQTITSRVAQQGDPVEVLLARLLASQSQRVTGTALALATRSSTTLSSLIDCTGFRAIILYFRINAVPGVDTVTLGLRGVDPVSGFAFVMAQRPAISLTGSYIAVFGGSSSLLAVLPDQIRAEVQHSGSGNFDYSVGYCLIP